MSFVSQPDLFGTVTPSTSALGLLVVLPQACGGCGSAVGVVGSSAGPHFARRTCANCGRFHSWMPATDFKFVAEVIDVTGGRPHEAIVVRRGQDD
jgi:hypothetical protein